eukprot:6952937-Pyramimonas_sp.AAC.1
MGQVFVQQLGLLHRCVCPGHEDPLDGPVQRHPHLLQHRHVHGLPARLWARCQNVRGVPSGGVHDRCATVGPPEGHELHWLCHE